jgi:hypothetical protein
MPTKDDVRRISLSLPDAIEAESGFSFSVAGKQFAWPYPERVPGVRARVPRFDVFVVRVANESDKQALLAGEPATFFTTDHYNGYPAVMVRLDAISNSDLVELLTDAHLAARQPKKRTKNAARRSGEHPTAD